MLTIGSRSLRRIAVGSMLSTVLCAAVAVAAAPPAAAAAPGCVGPIDDVLVCTEFGKVGSPAPVIGQVSVEDPDNVSMQGVLVLLEECRNGVCSVVSVATGDGKAVHTPTVPAQPGSTYRTTASWVDTSGRQHHGVSTP